MATGSTTAKTLGSGPSGRPCAGYIVSPRPLGDGLMPLGDRAEQLALKDGEISGGRTEWHAMATFHRASVSPHSRFSARGPGWPARPRGASQYQPVSTTGG